jgi:hypothetical protein
MTIISEAELDRNPLNPGPPVHGPLRPQVPQHIPQDGVEIQGVMGAGFSRENTVGAELDRQRSEDELLRAQANADLGAPYDPLSDIPERHVGFAELYVENAIDTESANVITKRLDQQQQDELTLQTEGFQGLAARMVAAVFDPTAVAVLPLTTLSKMGTLGKIALGAGALGGSQVAQEAFLHHANDTRTIEESNIAIGAATLMGGVLGPLIAPTNKALLDEAIAELTDLARGQTKKYTVAVGTKGPVKVAINPDSIGTKFKFTRLDCP